MLRKVLGDEIRKANDELTLSHSERASFLGDEGQEVEHQDEIFATELVVEHRKLDVLERLVNACRRRMCAHRSGV